ncbi:MAG: bifunctional phosphoribosyl-AMP cyclohydrolase/phosphoribosyl-ATP diphosphatase HisIE [Firmicutes bacterium]|nr:bifunctional phosphoribosyl-AMP cyclohydrolase/phosphoribosyl-ATP diphosphatase HisIE [Bacillota bacterium]
MSVIYEDGKSLYPVIVQDQDTLQILLSAFADQTALDLTQSTGRAHFYSRSRHALWPKGDTSGNYLPISRILSDCDHDAFIYLAKNPAPACHRGTVSCFDDAPQKEENADPLAQVYRIVAQRLANADDAAPSYTRDLARGPLEKLLKKIGEEAIEVIVAAQEDASRRHADLVWETSDLLYHLSVALVRFDIPLADLSQELARRHHSAAVDKTPPTSL